uniref:Uncharacterized protein n=1 Tax=Arundo donax TaxID=35708 RepID=A0A0A9AJF6_ARUDO
MASCISPDTRKVATAAAAFPARACTGSYTDDRRMAETIRFHRRPQKSRSDVARNGLSNCRSTSMPSARPAAAVQGSSIDIKQ